jgi:hypothetical protein
MKMSVGHENFLFQEIGGTKTWKVESVRSNVKGHQEIHNECCGH